jgi:hypothetical protein
MQTQTNPNPGFGLQDLVDALRQRIDADTKLLTQVMSYWTKERPEQDLRDLEELVPISDIAEATGGKITSMQVRWQARNRDENGLASAFVKIGRKLYVNLPEYLRLVAKTGGTQ